LGFIAAKFNQLKFNWWIVQTVLTLFSSKAVFY
jgi:hypothetical protein